MRLIQPAKKVALFIGILSLSSCGNDDGATISINEPTTYVFERDGKSTVSFSGQTTRIAMNEVIVSSLTNTALEEPAIHAMFAHEEGSNDFDDADLNASDKSVRSKIAASQDYFSANTTDANAIKSSFDDWIEKQTSEVFPQWGEDASAGVAGGIQEAGGGSVRYVNAKGLEYNQAFAKGSIGALMVDQILNNYLSTSVLDAGSNRDENSAGTVAEGKTYTTMEHKWDEAYGYAYGAATDKANPNATIGADDSFLNKYIGRVEGDDDFAGIADQIFNAFKLGRAAIVASDYTVRDTQAGILRERISTVIGVRAVYYLQQGKAGLEQTTPDMASVFHDLSEGYGFVFSLQFTRNPLTDAPYFTKAEVDSMINDLMGDGDNGLWDVTPETLETLSTTIAAKFSFSVEEAGS